VLDGLSLASELAVRQKVSFAAFEDVAVSGVSLRLRSRLNMRIRPS
jgi:hypothetical protein